MQRDLEAVKLSQGFTPEKRDGVEDWASMNLDTPYLEV